jgi:hypothetical protein
MAAYGMGVGKGESVYSTGWRKPRQKRAGRRSRADEMPADLACPVIIAAAPMSARRAASGTDSVRCAERLDHDVDFARHRR